MQNKYVADVGDFGKHGLLRFLSGKTAQDDGPQLPVGLIWYLHHDVRCNGDGRHTDYVKRTSTEDRSEYRDCDPCLWETLRDLVVQDARCVHCAEDAGLPTADAAYFNALLQYTKGTPKTMREEQREYWWRGATRETGDAELVFLDPDNGLASEDKKFRLVGPKFTYMTDLRDLWERGKSLIFYQQVNRTGLGGKQVKDTAQLLAGDESGLGREPIPLWFGVGTARVFYVLPQPEHEELIEGRVSRLLAGPWQRHFRRMQK